jgi:membrane protein involved in D-alanine export
MIPYTSFLYFGISLYAVIPAVLSGLTRRFRNACIALATLGMLMAQYWPVQFTLAKFKVHGFWLVFLFGLFQYGVACAYAALRRRSENRWIFYSAILLSLLPLLLIKFLPLADPAYAVGFLGISYVTFRSLDVLFGLHDRVIQAVPPVAYLSYLLFFTTVSSGPIDRFTRWQQDWNRPRSREDFYADLDSAVHHIFTGFLYKFILAALIKTYWLDPISSAAGTGAVISYMYAYSLYLFFDFAGYSAFAVGFSYLFGIHTPENFNRPFLARNIRDFWNRWHISLSTWFRDHVYSRFVYAAIEHKWFANKHAASYLGFFVSFGLMGLWHGTALHFIVYGLYHAALLSAYEWFNRWNKKHKVWGGSSFAWRAVETVLTVHLVCFGFLIFSGRLG